MVPGVPKVPGVPRVPRVPDVQNAEPQDWRKSFRKRAEVSAIAGLGYPVLRMLGSTWKWRVSGAEHVEAIRLRGLHPIHSFWHGRILPATLYFQRRGIVVITSENYDGEWIARIITKFGYGTARGSHRAAGRRRCCRWSAMYSPRAWRSRSMDRVAPRKSRSRARSGWRRRPGIR
jgi:hypothetical protein